MIQISTHTVTIFYFLWFFMNDVAIVAEYNPFHTGHLHQVDLLREQGAKTITAVMTGDFVQRCNPAVLPKHIRAEIAVRNGVDLVIELPFVFGTSSASVFAKGSVSLVNDTGIFDTLCFGSENGSKDYFIKTAEKIVELEHNGTIAEYIRKGNNYPRAVTMSLKDAGMDISDKPNDVLGMEYTKNILSSGSAVDIFTHKRTVDYFSDKSSESFASGEYIRQKIENDLDASSFICDYDLFSESYRKYGFRDYKSFETALIFNVRKYVQDGSNPLAVNPDLFNRISKYSDSNRLSEMIEKIKTKRYTYSSVKRALFSIGYGLYNNLDTVPTYVRVLAFNEKGRALLRRMKKISSLPIYHCLPQVDNDYISAKEAFATSTYGLLTNQSYDDYKMNSVKIDIKKGHDHETDLQGN